MKNFLTIVSMALILVTAAAVSAYCGNAPETASNQTGDMQTLSGGLLAAELAAQDSQGGASNTVEGSADNTIGTPPLGTPGTGDPVPGCKNGMAVGNKHCVSTPSE
jgi:hypothetical protein